MLPDISCTKVVTQRAPSHPGGVDCVESKSSSGVLLGRLLLEINKLIADGFGYSLCSRRAFEFFSRRIQMKSYGPFSYPQNDARLPGGLARSRPFETVELLGR